MSNCSVRLQTLRSSLYYEDFLNGNWDTRLPCKVSVQCDHCRLFRRVLQWLADVEKKRAEAQEI